MVGRCASDAVVATINKSSCKDTNGDVLHEQRPLKSVHVDNNLTPQEVKQLNDLILEFSDIFDLDQSEPSSTDVVTHVIDTAH